MWEEMILALVVQVKNIKIVTVAFTQLSQKSDKIDETPWFRVFVFVGLQRIKD